VVALDTLPPEVHGAARRYISTVVPWLPRFAREKLGLASGFPLYLGGFRFGPITEQARQDARAYRDSGCRFQRSLSVECDPAWRRSEKIAKEQIETFQDIGGEIDPILGRFSPEELEAMPVGDWRDLDEQLGYITTFHFRQLKPNSTKPSVANRLRARDVKKRLAKARKIGCEPDRVDARCVVSFPKLRTVVGTDDYFQCFFHDAVNPRSHLFAQRAGQF
jgi:hypothetical protein